MDTRPLPYSVQQLDEADIAAVVEVLRGDWLTQGPVVGRFEAALCERFEVKHAVAVSSGTAALHLSCLALGLGPRDEVITSPNTFVASANCVLYCGATVRFADIDPESFNISPSAVRRALGVSHGTLQGIIPVHFAGRPCEMEQIHQLARERGLWIIEDACHAPGARWRDSQGVWHTVGNCSHSDATCLSFHPVKHFTTGEGGAVLTNRSDLYERLVRLRSHGITREPDKMTESHGPWYYQMIELGFNYRLSDIQCGLGLSQLRHLDQWLIRRRIIAADYDEKLARISEVKVAARNSNHEHAYHLYVVQLPRRRQVLEHLRSAGIGCQVHYIPVHTQPYYQSHFGYRCGDFPAAERYYEMALSLPMFPAMTEQAVDRVVTALAQALAETKPRTSELWSAVA